MSSETILALIIPVYNEQENITKLIKKINDYIKIPIKIYFIYDSNEDPTIKVINQEKNNCKFPIEIKKNNDTRHIPCYLADWGYLKNSDRCNLPNNIKLLKLKDLEQLLAI